MPAFLSSWACRVLVVQLLSIYLVSCNTRIVARWDEAITLWGTTTEKLSLLERFGYIHVSDQTAREYHKTGQITVHFDLHVDDFEWSDEELAFTSLQFGRHLQLNRILNLEGQLLASLWTTYSNLTYDRMFSFEHELKSLVATRSTLLSVRAGEPSDSNKVYSTHSILAIELVAAILTDLSTQHTRITDATVKSIIQQYHTQIQAFIPTDYTTTKHNVMNLLYAYIKLTLVPFMHTYYHQNKDQTIRVLYNSTASFAVDNSTHTHQLLVTEQNHRTVHTLHANSTDGGSIELYEAYRLTYSLPLDKDSSSVYNNTLGMGIQTAQRVECVSFSTDVNGANITNTSNASDSTTYCEVDTYTLPDYFRLISSAGLSIYFLTNNTINSSGANQRDDTAARECSTTMTYDAAPMAPLHIAVQDLRRTGASTSTIRSVLQERQDTIRRRAYKPAASPGLPSQTTTHTSTIAPNILPARTLLLGLGAGHYHHHLLHFYPHMTVDSVEIDYNVYTVARSVLQFNVVCRVYNVSCADGVVETSTVLDESSYETSSGSYGSGSAVGACRSTVYIADAWVYVQIMSSRLTYHTTHHTDLQTVRYTTSTTIRTTQPSVLPTATYDIIVVDLFDSSAALWNGTTDQGQCNPTTTTDTVITNMYNLYDILTPCSGVAMLHIPRDAYFVDYLSSIRKVFGADQVVKLRAKSSDYVIVASRGKFIANNATGSESVRASGGGEVCGTVPHPCTDLMRFADWVQDFASSMDLPNVIKYGYRYSLDCSDL